MPSTNEWFAEAQKLHQAQRFAEAEALYRRIVQADANHAPAWHHLGMVCLAQDKLSEAADGFQCAIAISPANVDSLTQLGIALARSNKLEKAIGMFRQAIELRPEYAKAHNNLGVALTQLGRRDEGFACYEEATKLQPDYAEAHFNLAVAYSERRQSEEAIVSYRRALAIRPDYLDVLFNLGLILVNERLSEEAVTCLEQAVRMAPDNPEAHNNLSLALADVGRFEDSVAASDAALRLRPLDAKSHMNRGNTLSCLGRLDAAIANYDLALRLQSDYVNARWNRSLALLAKGDYERGWAEYEYRWKKPETKARSLPQPLWDGSSLEGKTILLWCEQGLGDTLQFVRFASLLKERGAVVWLECPAKMVSLFSTGRGIDRIFAEGDPLAAEFDCHAPLMSLPFLCGTKLRSVPADIPYLAVDPTLVTVWRKKLSASRAFKIGVAWQGNPKHRWDRHRSFSAHWFRSLAMLEGVELYSLQKDHGSDELATVRFPITDLRSQLDELGGTFLETAAAMSALDLVITCDSALAHLAGALGIPVWVVMSALSDWRWLRDREDSPWYPTVRLFRQSDLGDWRPVFERIHEEVLAMQETRSSRRNVPKKMADNPNPTSFSPSEKVLDWPSLMARRDAARATNLTTVWTNGCFDLVHVGHIRNLQAARKLGDLLVVGVNSDESVRRLKGPDRPILPATERAELLAALACVDYVIIFDEDTPLEAIARLQPDIHCKGEDYAPPNGKPIPEEKVVEGYGGRIVFLTLVPGTSTSDLLCRIRGGLQPDATESCARSGDQR